MQKGHFCIHCTLKNIFKCNESLKKWYVATTTTELCNIMCVYKDYNISTT